ncbi:LacI family DNA-binding transcriptional regulator [Pseudoduganella namucuonensis]|uniref:Transcriptional regulator, LacI family n=1 Tax=Pseudoduganella namucuonensis TaxID=1035707 RepID=A0A1I7M637_9BURK|nr:LacI family DNA-binding transcriptional regulator [Pseudoduganella namucuonensis]SFV17376.1 transcriptional regulator, LacI family [Pseudoduganella namucuonensis]
MSNATATLNDVAGKAGVSVMTASRALSGEGYVAQKTREKVVAAAEELGYTPNLSAKMMKGSRTNVVGVLLNDLNSSVINAVVGAISTAVRKAGMDMIIYNAVEDLGSPGSKGANRMLQGLCDGLLLVMPKVREGHIEALERSKLPIVLINYCRTETSLPVVRGDNYFGAREAVRHLVALGHRRIAFITGSAYSGQSGERQRGYNDALNEAGIAPDAQLVVQGDFGQLSGFEAGQKLLGLGQPPTAIFAANDEMAFGVMDAARANGKRIPQDVSIIGFDDIPAAAHVHPPLTTIRQPLQQISDMAVQELLRRIAASPEQRSRTDFPSELVIRESCGPAPLPVAKPGRRRAPTGN